MTPKAFEFSTVEIGSITSRKDKSISFRVVTNEIPAENLAYFFQLNGINCKLSVIPHEAEDEPPIEVKGDPESKTPGQRLRGLWWAIWKEEGSQGNFDTYYAVQMERACQKLKDRLDNLKA
jgi:hypothetical protein